jgi:prevent-host-death family protein
MVRVPVHEAKTQLSRLIAQVEQGEDVIILRGRVPVARLVPFAHERPRRAFGALRGQIDAPAAAFVPMSDDELADWGL